MLTVGLQAEQKAVVGKIQAANCNLFIRTPDDAGAALKQQPAEGWCTFISSYGH